jgi:hypothetical protein
LFLESDCEFDKRDFQESINVHLNDSEKKLFCAISKKHQLTLKRQRLMAN